MLSPHSSSKSYSSEKLKPIHAQGFFSIDRTGLVYQVVVYDYYDEEEFYAKLVHRPIDYRREVERLYSSMQALLDQERVVVNGSEVRPEVYSVSFDHRADPRLVYITFIIMFTAPLRKGKNVYENWYDEETAEYDYEVFWIFPPGTVVEEVETKSEYELLGDDNILLLWARRGDNVGGYEKIVFTIA